jgi:hypothetical protein
MSSERLGRMPEGLEWLVQGGAASKTETVELSQAEPVTQTSSSYQELSQQYEKSLKQARELELNLLEARLKNTHTSQSSAKPGKRQTRSTQIGLAEGWTRATLIMREEHIEKLKLLAQQHASSMKDLVELAMTQFLKKT